MKKGHTIRFSKERLWYAPRPMEKAMLDDLLEKRQEENPKITFSSLVKDLCASGLGTYYTGNVGDDVLVYIGNNPDKTATQCISELVARGYNRE